MVGKLSVSIHASAREATIFGSTRHVWTDVSIHASAREATARCQGVKSELVVSIHASAREATERGINVDAPLGVSIHASAREATPISAALSTNTLMFQSTPPRGRRHDQLVSWAH